MNKKYKQVKEINFSFDCKSLDLVGEIFELIDEYELDNENYAVVCELSIGGISIIVDKSVLDTCFELVKSNDMPIKEYLITGDEINLNANGELRSYIIENIILERGKSTYVTIELKARD